MNHLVDNNALKNFKRLEIILKYHDNCSDLPLNLYFYIKVLLLRLATALFQSIGLFLVRILSFIIPVKMGLIFCEVAFSTFVAIPELSAPLLLYS